MWLMTSLGERAGVRASLTTLLSEGCGEGERSFNDRLKSLLRERFQILTLNSSPFLSDVANAASSCGICSRSRKLTTSTGECM